MTISDKAGGTGGAGNSHFLALRHRRRHVLLEIRLTLRRVFHLPGEPSREETHRASSRARTALRAVKTKQSPPRNETQARVVGFLRGPNLKIRRYPLCEYMWRQVNIFLWVIKVNNSKYDLDQNRADHFSESEGATRLGVRARRAGATNAAFDRSRRRKRFKDATGNRSGAPDRFSGDRGGHRARDSGRVPCPCHFLGS